MTNDTVIVISDNESSASSDAVVAAAPSAAPSVLSPPPKSAALSAPSPLVPPPNPETTTATAVPGLPPRPRANRTKPFVPIFPVLSRRHPVSLMNRQHPVGLNAAYSEHPVGLMNRQHPVNVNAAYIRQLPAGLMNRQHPVNVNAAAYSGSRQHPLGLNLHNPLGLNLQNPVVGMNLQNPVVGVNLQNPLGMNLQNSVGVNLQNPLGMNLQNSVGMNLQNSVGVNRQNPVGMNLSLPYERGSLFTNPFGFTSSSSYGGTSGVLRSNWTTSPSPFGTGIGSGGPIFSAPNAASNSQRYHPYNNIRMNLPHVGLQNSDRTIRTIDFLSQMEAGSSEQAQGQGRRLVNPSNEELAAWGAMLTLGNRGRQRLDLNLRPRLG